MKTTNVAEHYRRLKQRPAKLAEDQNSVLETPDKTTPARAPQPLSSPHRLPLDRLEADLLTLRPFDGCGRPHSSIPPRRQSASSSSLPLLKPSSANIPPSYRDPRETFPDRPHPLPVTTTTGSSLAITEVNGAGLTESRDGDHAGAPTDSRAPDNGLVEEGAPIATDPAGKARNVHRVDSRSAQFVGWARTVPMGRGKGVMEVPSPFPCHGGTPVTQGRGESIAIDFSRGVAKLFQTADGLDPLVVETAGNAAAAGDGDFDVIKEGGRKIMAKGACSRSEGFLKEKRPFFSGVDDGYALGLQARMRRAKIDTKRRDERRREEKLSAMDRITQLDVKVRVRGASPTLFCLVSFRLFSSGLVVAPPPSITVVEICTCIYYTNGCAPCY